MTSRRTEPYTARGIGRIRCQRCGAKAEQQWQVCSDGNVFRGICTPCDIAINRLVLTFLRDPEVEAKMVAYTAKMLGTTRTTRERSETSA